MGIDLNKLVTDLQLIIRGSQVSQSEPISKRQIEDWVHQYRALLLKRDIDKGRTINSDYIQEIPDLEVDLVEKSEDNPINSGCYLLKSVDKIPKTLDLHFSNGITYVGNILGRQFQIVPYNRLYFQKYKKYASNLEQAAIRNQYIYITNNKELKYINVRGVFENPLELEEFSDIDFYSNYPLPQDKIPLLKEMVLQKELNISAQSPSDTKNDSAHGVSPNVERQAVQQQPNTN